jgi:hypothetical protein
MEGRSCLRRERISWAKCDRNSEIYLFDGVKLNQLTETGEESSAVDLE